jgi:hypothetical protein
MENIPPTTPNQPITVSTPGKPDRKKKSRENSILVPIELFTDNGLFVPTVMNFSYHTPTKDGSVYDYTISVKK